MATEWYYARSGSQVGPISTEDVRRRLVSDGFPANALVWREGLENWQRPQDIPELRQTKPPPLPSVPNSANGKRLPIKILRLLFSFFGRINRAKYWLGLGIVYAIFGAAMASWMLLSPNETGSSILGLVMMVGLVSLLSIISKRLHDLSITAWWAPVVLAVITFISVRSGTEQISTIVFGVSLIWLGCKKGTPGPNRHGPDPLERTA